MDISKFNYFLKNPDLSFIDPRLLLLLVFNITIIILLLFFKRNSPLGIKSVVPDFALVIVIAFTAIFLKYLEHEFHFEYRLYISDTSKITTDNLSLIENRLTVNGILTFIILFGAFSFIIWLLILLRSMKDENYLFIKKLIDERGYVKEIESIQKDPLKRITKKRRESTYVFRKNYSPLFKQYVALKERDKRNNKGSKIKNFFMEFYDDLPYYGITAILVTEYIVIFELTFTNRF